jgi:thiol-disulfide isomerase/thioredoxin
MIRRSVRSMLMVAPIVLAGLAGAAFGAPPTDEQVDAAAKSVNEALATMRKEKPDFKPADLKPAADKALEGISISEASLDQIKKLGRTIFAADRGADARARLAELAKDESDQGANAAIMALDFLPPDAPSADVAAGLKTALAHPAMPKMVREGKAVGLFYNLDRDDAATQQLAEPILALGAMMDEQMTPAGVAAMPMYFGALKPLREAHAPKVETIRTNLVAAIDRTIPTADEKLQGRLKKQRALVDGAAAKGQLLDHYMPAMNITWSSDPAIKSFDDLKGKVVVVDFWATWCGPCIASFPNVRDLQKHYEGYPVAIIGVTSLQGRHIGPDGPIDTKGDAQKEYSLMPEFMKQKEMTWPVFFTEQEVFNPDFGVQGIPHVAIIDPSGKVRFNGLHPADKAEEKYSKIDTLLKEANLPAPVSGG